MPPDPFLWPSGDGVPLVQLSLDPDELAATLDIEFTRCVDDLDEYVSAVMNIEGDWYQFVRYAHAPEQGTTVIVDANANKSELLSRFVKFWLRVEKWGRLANQRGAENAQLRSENAQLRAENTRLRSPHHN